MSKPSSGHFLGTIGDRYKNQTTSSQRVNNKTRVTSWAQKEADKLSAISNRQREKFNTATVVYDESTGKYYYGRNKGIELNKSPKNPILFGDSTHEGLLPKKSLNGYKIGNCSEVDALNNALNSGANLKNLHVTTIHTTKSGMGRNKNACKNCTFSFKYKVKRNYTGWFKED